jgi:hypothetical protein
VGLILVWGNLAVVLLPFLASLSIASICALPLRRAAEASGLPRAREPCVDCRGERTLLKLGWCPERCAVNSGPTIPLLLFVATATTALFALIDPTDFVGFVLPLGITGSGIIGLVEAVIVGANAGSALLIAGYFYQDRPGARRSFVYGAIVVALGTMALSGFLPEPSAHWIALATPLSLAAVLLSTAVEWRARYGRPAFGLRAVGFATAPLYLVITLALIRAVQVVQLAAA